jgi:hypothetical protein
MGMAVLQCAMRTSLLLLVVGLFTSLFLSSCAFSPCPNGYAPSYSVTGIGRNLGFGLTCTRDVDWGK